MQRTKTYLLHFALFAVTFLTTTFAGTEWTTGKSIFSGEYNWQHFLVGMHYSVPFLLILTAHEFGHYFVAIYYRVKVTLPYFIPLPPPFMLGTLGALIRMKSPIRSTKENFDIGIAGPLAGFVVSLGVLWYGFTHLPPPEYVFQFHPEYQQYGLEYADYVYDVNNMPKNVIDMTVGKNLLLLFFEKFVGDPARIPNVHELMHYPYLLAGFLSLVFTSMNLLPIGQLDGGHVVYGLLGFKWHRRIATVFFIGFLFYAGLGYINPYQPAKDLMIYIPLYVGFLFFALKGLHLNLRDNILAALLIFTMQYALTYFFPTLHGYPGWLLFIFILGRFVGIQHPPSEIEQPLSTSRIVLGWLTILIFILCFTPQPLNAVVILNPAP